ncbi:hypothetical protein [Herbiconiux flava]|jgi:hypothetical protein|uniref:DUF1146 domain-containing protein n=1 Tax=Herbiconiux flava TaxID=881268 RepID=A0A852S6M4_9MICO|nr:hypothetical protein [Herbiconiux flava]NYD68928.1 hypothetical protein [Herbiconiux flava]GLK15677.1 hypothetical protein GCM10017602_01590 [Herbiconiux flava]
METLNALRWVGLAVCLALTFYTVSWTTKHPRANGEPLGRRRILLSALCFVSAAFVLINLVVSFIIDTSRG